MSLLGPSGQPLSTEPSTSAPSAPQQVTTAFLVIVEHSGRVAVNDDLTTAVTPVRKPSVDDVLGAAANVYAEMVAKKTAQATAPAAAQLTVQTQMAVSKQMMEAQQNAQIQQMLAKSGKP